MVKYAREQRNIHAVILGGDDIDTPESLHIRAFTGEIYANLDQAQMMIEVVIAARDVQGETRRLALKDFGANGRALELVREIEEVRVHWQAEDAKIRKEFAINERKRRRALAAVVQTCAKNACLAVVLRARSADQQAKLRDEEEKRRRVQEEQARSEWRLAAHARIADLRHDAQP